MSLNKELFTSNSDEWETPSDLFNKLNNLFHFTLDACANNENKKCDNYFSKKDNGLIQKWEGIVWCNPPYSDVKTWVVKASKLEAETCVFLVPARVDTKWFQNNIKQASVVCFIKGRLKFSNSKNSAPFPSCLIIFGNCSKEQFNSLISLGWTIEI